MFWESEGKDDDDEEYQDGDSEYGDSDYNSEDDCQRQNFSHFMKTTVRGKILAILASRDPSRIHHLSKCFIIFLAYIIKNDDAWNWYVQVLHDVYIPLDVSC